MGTKVSELSGVSVRTLHFYDEIGLLEPAHVGENGYRYYEKEQLLLLQQILFYRKLGFGLEQIQKILKDPGFDKVKALKEHRSHLEKDASRLKELIQTIDNTLANLRGEKTMKEKDLYHGFAPEKQQEYEKYIKDRFGKPAEKKIEETRRKMKDWSKEDFKRVSAELDTVLKEMTLKMRAGATADAPDIQQLVALHVKWLTHFWTPNRESYSGLADLYKDHPDFRKFYEAYDPKLVDFLAAAMKHYAEGLN